MSQVQKKLQNRTQRKQRIRKIVHGSAERPRLSVFISNTHVSAQLIDDDAQRTLAVSTTVNNQDTKGTLSERAVWVGQDIADKAKKAKIKTVVFDRNGRLYHGRLKKLADAAREAGLEF